MNQTADVVVVGLGAIGSAVAHHLAAGGAKVVGVDSWHPPHPHGSSHGETRITRLAIGEGQDCVPLVQRSHLLWRSLEAKTGMSLMVQTGGLIISAAAADRHPHHGQAGLYDQTVRAAERFGIAHERLGAAEIRHRFPAFTPADDERGYFEPEAGFLRPEACVTAQLQQAAAHGADLRFDTVVQRVDDARGGGGGCTVQTDAGGVSAAHVVMTAGAWLPAMLSPVPNAPHALHKRFTVQRQVLNWFAMSQPALYEPSRCPVFIWMHGADGAAFYGFPRADHHDGVKVATEQTEVETSPDAVERHVGEVETAKVVERHIRGRLQGLSSRSVHHSTCLYTSTVDGRFVIDRHPRLANATVVSACSGHG